MNSRIVVLLFLTLMYRLCGSSQTVNIDSYLPLSNLGHSVQYIELSDERIGIDSIDKILDWSKCEEKVPTFGLSTKAIWLKLDVKNNSENRAFIMEVDYSSLDLVELYSLENGSWNFRSITCETPIEKRLVKNQSYCFPIQIEPSNIQRYYLKVKNGDTIHIPLKIALEEQMLEAHNTRDIWFSIFTGIMLAMLMANVFIFFITKERSYIYYVIYIGIVYLTQSNFQGYTVRWFVSFFPALEQLLVFILSALVGISAMLFMIVFLNVKNVKSKVITFIGIYLLAIILAFSELQQIAFLIIEINAGILASWMLYTAYIRMKHKNAEAKNFIIAWVVFLIGVMIFVLKDFGILPFNTYTHSMITVGSALEAVLLSFALADRINQLKREKEAAQVREIEAMRYNEDIIRNQNILLENKVQERTIELETANFDLQTSYNDLRMTQKQLLESEKLASLGQMTAGIAHELNNPINFVSSNVGPLRRDVEDIVNLLLEYHNLGLQATPEQLDRLRLQYKQKDIDFTRQEISQLLHGIEEGSKRTSDIVKGLRIFARADKDTIVNANINDCLNSTLVVMKSAYKGEVNLSREVDMQMPMVDCYPGKLNQVLVNLINNAVHATDLPGRAPQERIVIVKSYFDDNNIHISVKDNGCGIPPEVKAHMFEPFYTTKAVGEGTGLGLAIVMGIIEEHDGKIEVFTEKDKGTEFIIHLPRHRSNTTLTAA